MKRNLNLSRALCRALWVLSFVVFGFPFMASAQKSPLVTLSHNGDLTIFNTAFALEDAIEKAVRGDTIFLSNGVFSTKASTIILKKKISFVGNGHKYTRISSEIVFDNGSSTLSDKLPIFFDGVYVNTLKFQNISSGIGGQVLIKNSRFGTFDNAQYAGEECLIDRCYISNLNLYSSNKSDVNISNSKIVKFYHGDECVMSNCNVYQAQYIPLVLRNSIVYKPDGNDDFIISSNTYITHSLLGKNKFRQSYSATPSGDWWFIADGTELLTDDCECPLDLEEKGYLGDDGTVIGIHGGVSPYSEIPTTPTVDQEKSSVEYDPQTNKLKVTVTIAEN